MAGQLSRLCLLRPHLVLQRPSAKSRGIGAKFVFPPKNLRRAATTTQSECYTRVLWKLHYIFRGLLLPIGLSSQNFDTVIIMLCLYIRAEQKYFKNPSLLPLCIESCSSNQNKQSNGCCKNSIWQIQQNFCKPFHHQQIARLHCSIFGATWNFAKHFCLKRGGSVRERERDIECIYWLIDLLEDCVL